MILKKVGRIGGDEGKVRSRLSHILSRIDRDIEFSISNVRVLGSGTQAPIYEVDLEDADSAEALRKSFKRFTRKKAPISRPPELDGVGVFNSVTHATRVRISILRVSYLVFFSFYFPFLVLLCFVHVVRYLNLFLNLCFQSIAIGYKRLHPSSVPLVEAFDARPCLRIKETDQGSGPFKRFSFVQAIQELDPVGTLGLLDADFKVFHFFLSLIVFNLSDFCFTFPIF